MKMRLLKRTVNPPKQQMITKVKVNYLSMCRTYIFIHWFWFDHALVDTKVDIFGDWFQAAICCFNKIKNIEGFLVILALILKIGKPGSEVIKLFSCSTQLSMKFKLLIITEIP